MIQLNLNLPYGNGGSIHVQADSTGALHEALAYLQHIGAIPTDEPAKTAPVDKVDASNPADGQKEAAPAKPPRKPRAPAASTEPSKAPAPDTASKEPGAADAKAPAVKVEEVTAAITRVANSPAGLSAARDLLAKFDVKRAAELKPEQFGAFVAAADELVAAQPAPDPEESADDLM